MAMAARAEAGWAVSRLPTGMTPEHAARLARLTDEQRDRVTERAAIIWESTGCSWADADERALAAEVGPVQRTLLGDGT